MLRILICIVFLFTSNLIIAQDYVFNIPQVKSWYTIEEGDTISFKFEVLNKGDEKFKYKLVFDENHEISFDSLGNFFWVPSYNLVSRIDEVKKINMLLEAENGNTKINKKLEFIVNHRNRAPIVESTPTYYIKQYSTNEFNLYKHDQIKDPDQDPIVFIPNASSMPQGATLSELGTFKWSPSRTQFRKLQSNPKVIKFKVQDQPEKKESEGEFIIAPTQMDLPPDILIVPSDSVIVGMEDEVFNLSLYITDPNGDDDILDVSFLSNNESVPKNALVKNTSTQWEFKWMPGYDFLNEVGKIDTLSLTFFAVDKSGKKIDKKIQLSIEDAENIAHKDERLFVKYKVILVEAMDLLQQLEDNQRLLNKQLRKAKKGKKNRSIVNASLGAITGVSPVFLEDQSKDYVTGLGGTAVLTLGTLEATEVMGRSKDDILDKLKINIDIQNQIQAEGDRFARKYNLKTKRRVNDFNTDITKFKAELNNKKLILLELPADWENSKKPTDRNINKVFPDYNNEGLDQ